MRMVTGDNELALAAAGGDREAFATLLERHYDGPLPALLSDDGSPGSRGGPDAGHLPCVAGEAETLSRGSQADDMAVPDCRERGPRPAAPRLHARENCRGLGPLGDESPCRRGRPRPSSSIGLRHAMAALPEDLRDTAALTLGEELTHAEAAQVLGISGRHRQLAPRGNPQAPPCHSEGGVEVMTDPLDDLRRAFDGTTPVPGSRAPRIHPGPRNGSLRRRPRIGGLVRVLPVTARMHGRPSDTESEECLPLSPGAPQLPQPPRWPP